MIKTLKCYATPRANASHVNICLERAAETVELLATFVNAIAPEGLPAGVHASLLEAVAEAGHTVHLAKAQAPAVRGREA